ncbi:MAG: hypothetical protein IJR85_05130 [Synergistaceae bacterium]|nr:hypothetical protein [Synergistaceae bacterium]
MQTGYSAIFYEYGDFIRRKNAMMERIGQAMEDITQRLVYDSEGMTASEREELEGIQDRLEAIYESLEAVIS